jgi:hypothetical protein
MHPILHIVHAICDIVSMGAFCLVFVCLLGLIPRKSRVWAAAGLIWCSSVLGFYVWYSYALSCYHSCGLAITIMGILFGGVGIIPMFFIESILHGEWGIALGIIVSVAGVWTIRLLGIWVATKCEREAEENFRLAQIIFLEEEAEGALRDS